MGTELLKDSDIHVLKVPSVIIPQEFNCIINPMNIDKSVFEILDSKAFIDDNRN